MHRAVVPSPRPGRLKIWYLHPSPDFSWLQEHVWSADKGGFKWGCCIFWTILCSLFPSPDCVEVFSPIVVCVFLLFLCIFTTCLFLYLSLLVQNRLNRNTKKLHTRLSSCHNHSWKIDLVSMGTKISAITVNQDTLAFVCCGIHGLRGLI